MTVFSKSKKKIKRRFTYDATLLFPVLFLVGFGIVMVYSASSALSLKVHGHGYYYLQRQAAFSLIGIIVMIICRHIPYRLFGYFVYPLLFSAIGLLILVLVPGFGVTAGGSTRWLGIAGLTFQPSELARLAIVMYLAYSLTKKQAKLDVFSIGFVPHVIVLAVLAVLIGMEPDFGSVVILTILDHDVHRRCADASSAYTATGHFGGARLFSGQRPLSTGSPGELFKSLGLCCRPRVPGGSFPDGVRNRRDRGDGTWA